MRCCQRTLRPGRRDATVTVRRPPALPDPGDVRVSMRTCTHGLAKKPVTEIGQPRSGQAEPMMVGVGHRRPEPESTMSYWAERRRHSQDPGVIRATW